MATLDQLEELLKAREQETAEARERLLTAHASVAAAESFYDSTPTDEAFDAIERAKSKEQRAHREVSRLERHEKAAREELGRERVTAWAAEHQALVTVLHRHPYGPELAAQAEIDRMHEERVVKPMLAKNAERRAQWDRAAELARKLGDIGFPARVPRPQPNEAVVLARVATAKARIAEGRRDSTAHEFIDPFFKPTWNDALAETHANAMHLLENGATQ